MSVRGVLVAAQFVTFVALGAVMLAGGAWRLGLAQWLLAAVTGLVYW